MPTNITGSSLADTMGQAEWIMRTGSPSRPPRNMSAWLASASPLRPRLDLLALHEKAAQSRGWPTRKTQFRKPMRCYFLRNNKIEGVELLSPGPDEALIQQVKALFQAHANQNYDGFEVWETRRLVYRSLDHETGELSGVGGPPGGPPCCPRRNERRSEALEPSPRVGGSNECSGRGTGSGGCMPPSFKRPRGHDVSGDASGSAGQFQIDPARFQPDACPEVWRGRDRSQHGYHKNRNPAGDVSFRSLARCQPEAVRLTGVGRFLSRGWHRAPPNSRWQPTNERPRRAFSSRAAFLMGGLSLPGGLYPASFDWHSVATLATLLGVAGRHLGTPPDCGAG